MFCPRRPVKQRWSETHSGCTRPTSAFEVVEVAPVERIDRADRQRHAMQRHRIVAADAVEPVQRTAARHHVVLRQRLEPAHPAGAGGDLLVMLGPQSQPEADLGGAHAVDSTFSKARTSAISRAAALSSRHKRRGRDSHADRKCTANALIIQPFLSSHMRNEKPRASKLIQVQNSSKVRCEEIAPWQRFGLWLVGCSLPTQRDARRMQIAMGGIWMKRIPARRFDSVPFILELLRKVRLASRHGRAGSCKLSWEFH